MSDLELTLSVPKAKYVIGEEVIVLATVRNHTSQMVPFPNLRAYPAPQPVYEVRGPDGKTVVYDPIPPEHRAQAELPGYPSWLIPLQPGGEVTGKLIARLAVPMSQPGEYSISARFKWRGIDLVADPIRFRLASIRMAEMSLAVRRYEPGGPATDMLGAPGTWGSAGYSLAFRMTEDGGDGQLAGAIVDWGAEIDDTLQAYSFAEWPLHIGGAHSIGASGDGQSGTIYVEAKWSPPEGKLIPTESSSPLAFFWTPDFLQFGWETSRKRDSFQWFKIPSPKPIVHGLRVLYTSRPRTEKSLADAFVVFAGETADLGRLHVDGVLEMPSATALRPIASLGPGWVAAQAIMGPEELGEPQLIASIARHEAGTRITFLRIGSNGAIAAKAERVLSHMIPLGPVAMQVRTAGAFVEAAFPVKDARSGDLHAVRVRAPVTLTEIAEPVVLPAIPLSDPAPTMLIDFSWFGDPFPQGVGLLLRQPGDKSFFWTEQRGLKPLKFTLRDQDEALILGGRSAWYVLVNNGIQIRSEKVESFFDKYWPPKTQ
jgi:hypothetical protein